MKSYVVERNPKKGWDVVDEHTEEVVATHRLGWDAETECLERNNAEIDRLENLCKALKAKLEGTAGSDERYLLKALA
jgi:hypothetical protein